MQIGFTALTKIDDWKLAKEAEDLGFDAVWVPDSQMIWSDCYATMALMAQATSKVRIGTGVSIPGTRIAPVTAHSIASINRLAPGRVFLGIGTGHTAMRVMGMNPMRLDAFREYLQVVRTLLRGGEVDFTLNGATRSIQFLHQDLDFLNLEEAIPLYVAANGPKALQIAGEYGDGLISAGAENPDVVTFNLGMVKQGAETAGRTLPDDFHTVSLSNAVVLRPGETLRDDRVIDEAGAWATTLLHFIYEIYEQTHNEEMVPEFLHGVWEEYRESVTKMQTPKAKRYREIHNGHATFLRPEERRFVTPELIRGTHLVGPPEEIVEQIYGAERAGLKEITLAPSLEHCRSSMRAFGEVLARL